MTLPAVSPPPAVAPTFVLAPEVAAAWGLPATRNFYPSNVLTRLLATAAIAPDHWFYQVAELIRAGVIAGRMTQASAIQFLVDLRALPIRVDGETRVRAECDTFNLALTHRITVLEAAYLELSLRLSLPLATTDATLTRAATSAGVTIFTP